MKNFIFTVFAICICTTAFAQTQEVKEVISKYSLKKAEQNILKEEETTKTLILKYANRILLPHIIFDYFTSS